MTDANIIGVTGAGQMGAGIAQVFAQAGCTVHLHDAIAAGVEKGMKVIHNSLAKLSEKGKLSESAETIFARLSPTTHVQALVSCDLVIEAVPEDLALKTRVFTALDGVVQKQAVLASNTSSIAIAKLAAATQRPSQVIGMHFMNPVPLMPCVEVIRADTTSAATFTLVQSLVARLGKTMVVSKDRAGFIVNRILMPMINEAAHAVAEHIATVEDIDTAMKLSCNFPMGPLTLADFIGLDTVVSILEVMEQGLGDRKYAPCQLLRDYVAAGKLGRKSKQGFYSY